MRIFLRATACIMLFAATPAMAQTSAADCLALGRACVAHCLGGQGSTATLNPVTRVLPERVKACIDRCQVAPCQPTPLTARLCDATAQSICNNGFRACNDCVRPIDCDDYGTNPESGIVRDLLLHAIQGTVCRCASAT